MDKRYIEQGYHTEFSEEPYGAFMTIKDANNKVVGEVHFGWFSGDELSKPTIHVSSKFGIQTSKMRG